MVNNNNIPVFYSYLNCPYCQRARLAIALCGVSVKLREVALPTKPQELLTISPKGSVPVLFLADGTVVDESLDIIEWAIGQSDPVGLGHHHAPQDEIDALLEENDTRFAKALIRLKKPERFAGDGDTTDWESVATAYLTKLDARLETGPFLAGNHPTLVDIAVVPFVLQYRAQKPATFATPDLARLNEWCELFAQSPLYTAVMQEHPAWISGQEEPLFP